MTVLCLKQGESEVHALFAPLTVIGLYFCKDRFAGPAGAAGGGANTGEAFVEFESAEMARQALAWNREAVEGDR